MNSANQSLETLQDIKKMMERSSRFISLSGLSGISAGICALVGAWFAQKEISRYQFERLTSPDRGEYIFRDGYVNLEYKLVIIAICTFVAAFILAFLFTWLKSRKEGTPIWGTAARRLLLNTVIPMIAGGFLILKMIAIKDGVLIAPSCLLFYGLALVNGSKYTLGEVKYLGYAQIILGILNLWAINDSLIFWAVGFGGLHIFYGIVMWWKYERVNG